VVGELAAVQSTEAWDGRDGVAVEEDEFSLADIMAVELCGRRLFLCLCRPPRRPGAS